MSSENFGQMLARRQYSEACGTLQDEAGSYQAYLREKALAESIKSNSSLALSFRRLRIAQMESGGTPISEPIALEVHADGYFPVPTRVTGMIVTGGGMSAHDFGEFSSDQDLVQLAGVYRRQGYEQRTESRGGWFTAASAVLTLGLIRIPTGPGSTRYVAGDELTLEEQRFVDQLRLRMDPPWLGSGSADWVAVFPTEYHGRHNDNPAQLSVFLDSQPTLQSGTRCTLASQSTGVEWLVQIPLPRPVRDEAWSAENHRRQEEHQAQLEALDGAHFQLLRVAE